MKDIRWEGPLPSCDLCGEPAPYDAPTPREDVVTQGRWANLCKSHFETRGLDTSVTSRRVPNLSDDGVPFEVRMIADRWGGRDERVVTMGIGSSWGFEGDGFQYLVTKPGEPHACYEDSGMPCGDAVSDGWHVRAINDAPDSHWEVALDGTYYSVGREEVKIW